MAAADYYKAPLTMRTYEEELEIQAQDIEQQTLLFQTHLRGFLLRRRVSRYCEDDDAIENKGHWTSINTRNLLETRGTIRNVVDERPISDTDNISKGLAKIPSNAQYGEEHPKRDNVCAFDVGYTPGKAESTDLQAYYQEPKNIATNGSEYDRSYRNLC